MEALARTMPGFIDVKGYLAEDGERLTVVRWENQETMRLWREQERHRVAQQTGREQWYAYYHLEVAELVRARSFERPDDEAAGRSRYPDASLRLGDFA